MALCIWILLALAVLQVLTPFLHAHLGTPRLGGWHVHVPVAMQVGQHAAQTDAADARFVDGARSEEPPEVGVQRGLPADDGGLALFIVCSFAVLALLPLFPSLSSRTQPLPGAGAPPVRRRFQCAGDPPPALAPPARS